MILENGEEIRDIKGYESLYAVTNYGRIWSYPNNSNANRHGKWLKPGNVNGYRQVDLYKNKEVKHVYIHRLVYFAFSNEIDDGVKDINHIDCDKLNNRIEI
jgi:hypothetical protein